MPNTKQKISRFNRGLCPADSGPLKADIARQGWSCRWCNKFYSLEDVAKLGIGVIESLTSAVIKQNKEFV